MSSMLVNVFADADGHDVWNEVFDLVWYITIVPGLEWKLDPGRLHWKVDTGSLHWKTTNQ